MSEGADRAEHELERELGPEDERPGELAVRLDYSSSEKIVSFVRLVMAQDDEPMVRLIRNAHRFGMTRAVVSRLPAIDDAESWDALLAMLAGVALNLISDNVDVDYAGVRQAGAEALGQAFDRFEESG